MTTLDDRPATGGAEATAPAPDQSPARTEVSFDTSPDQYKHWTLSVDGDVATLTLDVAEDGGIVPGYELKMNSYDLGVDIELHDAMQRIRFEHPEAKALVVTSGKDRMFCAGANIKMLAASPHSWKVNFCKFTNETRNGIEDASAHSGLRSIAAVNGTAAGGGYELALACDEIVLVDDNSSAVSLPEVPLLGVLPGTGGLTRVVDKRGVRRDLADVFSTTSEGIRGDRAVQWRLVDGIAKAREFPEEIARRTAEAAATSSRPGAGAQGVALTPLEREVDGDTTHYGHVRVVLDRESGTATVTVLGPTSVPATVEELHEQGDQAWLLATTRELDDAILRLRTNELSVGTWLLRTEGDVATVAAYDEFLLANRDDWLVNETIGFYKRTVKRLDTTSRSLFALIEPGSCFAGLLAEIAFAADRSFMLEGQFEDDDDPKPPAVVRLDEFNTGLLPMSNDLTRLQVRFLGSADELAAAEGAVGRDLLAADALELGLVTSAPDDIDWEDEIRLVVEERRSFSPDALTGMEANLRFAGQETPETKVFGRLTAWQNWIFQRPNAAGPEGALRRYGTGQRADYDRKRV
ncbi:2,3-dihydro-2,3-dihydroxybenzoyl-CoA ring cleavage enzyme [Blastococcus colisei]|uniref:2,3-dihydro-2,3-dihydroxybenzoyl-CoA ring cleavage enzyme n=1 Tax=Blastococcus colisei TaxID=1564162 RepID=A0A543PFC7_9ACTN|nr:2,3-epoxybenzoyl-CoA dihydrolase [Blastococcus colisei]TQN42766.1 2,3-dihydro-2,3-dihydroxybenzoyl-CoA ring cleavage enzyme [Blastococcus colisei]